MRRLQQHIGSVPVLILHEERELRGTVLVYHGLTACKETQEKELASLARRGFLAVGVDAVGHGERRYPDLEKRMADENSHVHFLEMVRASVVEIPGLVCEIKKLFPNHGSFGLTGISMGGYIAFAAGAVCDDIVWYSISGFRDGAEWASVIVGVHDCSVGYVGVVSVLGLCVV